MTNCVYLVKLKCWQSVCFVWGWSNVEISSVIYYNVRQYITACWAEIEIICALFIIDDDIIEHTEIKE